MKPRRFEQHRSKSSMMCNRFSDFNVKSDKGKTPLIVLRCADNRQLFEGTGKGNGKAMKYAIYEGNLDRLEKKLKRIFNKCKAYGCDFHYEQTGEEFRELKDEKGNKYTARFVLVEAEGTAVINDWEFVAELEHTEKEHSIYIEGYTQKVKYAEQQIRQTKHRISQIQTGVKNSQLLRDSHRKNTKVWKDRNADVKKYRERLKEPRTPLKEQNEELRNLKTRLWKRQKAFDCNVRNKEFYKKVMQEIT